MPSVLTGDAQSSGCWSTSRKLIYRNPEVQIIIGGADADPHQCLVGASIIRLLETIAWLWSTPAGLLLDSRGVAGSRLGK